MQQDPGTTLSTALDLGDLSLALNISESNFVGSNDSIDIYKFTLNNTSNFGLNLTDETEDLNLELLYDRNNNNQLNDNDLLYTTSSTRFSRNPEINTDLGAGSYYVRVSQRDSDDNTSYNLELSANPAQLTIPDEQDPQSNFSNATNLGILEDNQTIVQFVGDTDLDDVYQFSLESTSIFGLSLENETQDIDLEIYYDRNNNNQLDDSDLLYTTSSTRFNRNPELSTDLGAGNYYVRVSQDNPSSTRSNNSTYSLELSANPAQLTIPDEQDPGTTIATAHSFGYFNLDSAQESLNFSQFVGDTDAVDVYKFSLDNISNFGLNLTDETQDLNVEILFDQNNNGILEDSEVIESESSSRFSRNPSLDLSLDSGSYYVRVSQDRVSSTESNNTTYNLELTSVGEQITPERQAILANSNQEQINRFFETQRGFHLYTLDENEINVVRELSRTGELNYSYEAEQFTVLNQPEDPLTGTKIDQVRPVYRFFNTDTGSHLYTMDDSEREFIETNLDNYNGEGIKYYAFETAPENIETVPLYRAFRLGAHLFSINQGEIDNATANLDYESEGVAFHVFALGD